MLHSPVARPTWRPSHCPCMPPRITTGAGSHSQAQGCRSGSPSTDKARKDRRASQGMLSTAAAARWQRDTGRSRVSVRTVTGQPGLHSKAGLLRTHYISQQYARISAYLRRAFFKFICKNLPQVHPKTPTTPSVPVSAHHREDSHKSRRISLRSKIRRITAGIADEETEINFIILFNFQDHKLALVRHRRWLLLKFSLTFITFLVQLIRINKI